jgi:hypothetical protein
MSAVLDQIPNYVRPVAAEKAVAVASLSGVTKRYSFR